MFSALKAHFQQGPSLQELSNRAFERLRETLDDFKREVDDDLKLDKTVVGTAIAASTGLAVGYVIWLLRSGMLITSMLTSMPAWRIADPLVILSSVRDDEDDPDGESLETIVKEGSFPSSSLS